MSIIPLTSGESRFLFLLVPLASSIGDGDWIVSEYCLGEKGLNVHFEYILYIKLQAFLV
jgi:hypothetical protein